MSRLWMPQVYGNPEVPPEPCAMTALASAFAALWLQALAGRAAVMHCDDRLIAAAQRHAEFLAARMGAQLEQSMHTGSGGSMPNDRVRAAGYNLVDWYKPGKNNVESCASNWQGPRNALERLLASPHHHVHLMGIEGFESHTVYGVGQSADYYVILICPPEP